LPKQKRYNTMVCFAIDEDTYNALWEYLYMAGKWDSMSSFMRWLVKAYFKKVLR